MAAAAGGAAGGHDVAGPSLEAHRAVERGAAPAQLRELLAADPSAARVRDPRDGMLALHVAATTKASVEVVRTLLEAFLEGAGVKDGETPAAIRRGPSGVGGGGAGAFAWL